MTTGAAAPWPAHFPPGCPPEDAFPAAGRVFRFVKTDPPTAADFLSHKERWPGKSFGTNECAACGLSVFTDWEDVERVKRDVPGMARKLVAECVLQPTYGLLKSTPAPSGPSHHTWWKYAHVAVHNHFTVVLTNGKGGAV